MNSVWIVESGTQEVNVVCRVFDNEADAKRYHATTSMWMTLHRERTNPEFEFSRSWATEGFYRHHTAGSYSVDDVIPELANSVERPFGKDLYSEFFTVAEYPFGWSKQ